MAEDLYYKIEIKLLEFPVSSEEAKYEFKNNNVIIVSQKFDEIFSLKGLVDVIVKRNIKDQLKVRKLILEGFSGVTLNIDYEGECEVLFSKITFHHPIQFKEKVKCKLEFKDCFFEEAICLNDKEVIKPIVFKGVEFESKFRGDSSMFLKGISFIYCNFKGKVQFSNTIVKGLADFNGASFSENGYFYKTRFDQLDLRYTVINEGIYFLDSKVKSGNRETFRIIKNQFISQNNKIESLEYYTKEMRSYIKEVFKDLFKVFGLNIDENENFKSVLSLYKGAKKVLFHNKLAVNIKDVLSSIFKLVILGFNMASNYFGRNWVQSLLIFLVITYLMYEMYLDELTYVFNHNSLKEVLDEKDLFWKYYINFIDPTSSVNLEDLNSDLVNCNYKHKIVKGTTESFKTQFYSRIIASLGIYQTIQAFRKYSFK